MTNLRKFIISVISKTFQDTFLQFLLRSYFSSPFKLQKLHFHKENPKLSPFSSCLPQFSFDSLHKSYITSSYCTSLLCLPGCRRPELFGTVFSCQGNVSLCVEGDREHFWAPKKGERPRGERELKKKQA